MVLQHLFNEFWGPCTGGGGGVFEDCKKSPNPADSAEFVMLGLQSKLSSAGPVVHHVL